MSSSTQSTIVYFNYIARELNRYIPLTFLTLGTIGNFLNILVFTRPLLRTNPCSIYFISSSIINFFSLYIGLLTPFLGLYNLDPTQKIDILCKIRFYFRYSTITLSTWFILVACIDRYISTSSNVTLRSYSSIYYAKRIVLITSLICFIFPYTQTFYCYTTIQKTSCTYQNSQCKQTNDIILLLCNSGLPPLLMVLFNILTIKNVNDSNRINNRSRRNIQLIKILFIQVFILVLFAIPITIHKLYSISTLYFNKNSFIIAIENLVNQISIEISYISNSTTFYIYSITNKKYRKEVYYLLTILFKFKRKNHLNNIHPMEMSRINQNKSYTQTHQRIE